MRRRLPHGAAHAQPFGSRQGERVGVGPSCALRLPPALADRCLGVQEVPSSQRFAASHNAKSPLWNASKQHSSQDCARPAAAKVQCSSEKSCNPCAPCLLPPPPPASTPSPPRRRHTRRGCRAPVQRSMQSRHSRLSTPSASRQRTRGKEHLSAVRHAFSASPSPQMAARLGGRRRCTTAHAQHLAEQSTTT